MDYKDKYIKYKTKYLELKNMDINNQFGGGNNDILIRGGARKKIKKCSIDDTDKVLFGDGGSSAIVVITKDKKVYKIFTLYNFTPDIELDKQIKDKNKRVNNEIKIYIKMYNYRIIL